MPALRPRTQLQDIFVNIESRGTPKAGELTGGERLAAHRTRTQVHLNRVLDVFEPAARARLKQMLDEMSEGLGGDGEQLRAAFVELAPFLDAGARLSRESAERDRTTRRLVHNSRLLFDELARRDRQLTQLVAAGSLTFGELARKRDAFAEMFRQLPPTLRRIDSSFATLRGTLDAVDPALTAFQAPARELAPALRSLRALSADARPALAQLRPAVKELVPTARALPPLSADLGEAFDALRPQAPRLDRITAAIVPCQLAVSKFFHHTISLAKFGDAHGVYPRGEAVFGSDAAGGREPNLHRGRSCTDGEGK